MHQLLVWNKFRNIVEALNQSRVSMNIVEKCKDFNPEIYSNFSMISETEKNQLFIQNFFPMKFWFRSFWRNLFTSGAVYDNLSLTWLYKKPKAERSGNLIGTFLNCQVSLKISWIWAESDKEISGKRFLKGPMCPEEILSTRERGAS